MGAATLTQDTISIDADPDRRDVRLAAAGDTAAFERVYRRHVARIHTLCRRMISPDEADDATQDVFIRAWQKLHLFRGDAAFGTWLYRLAVNVTLARRQKHARHRERFIASYDDAPTRPARGQRPDLRVDMEAAIRTLPPRARDVFLLHDVAGYRHDEIADMLNVTAGTTKSQLHRARMILRQHLA